VREKKTVVEERIVVVHQCDICGAETRCDGCIICERDVCWKCGYKLDLSCSVETPSFSGDYPDMMCYHCWEFGEPYRKVIADIREDAYEREEVLLGKWIADAKEDIEKCFLVASSTSGE
jgi:hypothetical protein